MFDALEWLAAMCSHMPNKGEQMLRYYGYYSNLSRGKRKKADADDLIPCILQPELADKAFRQNWARLIQKIYETDPLTFPRCNGAMHVIACIDDDQVIKKILKHLDLWDAKRKPPPRANSPPTEAFIIDDNSPGSRAPCSDDYIIDADRTTLRLSTGYPIDLSRPSFSEDGSLLIKKSGLRQNL